MLRSRKKSNFMVYSLWLLFQTGLAWRLISLSRPNVQNNTFICRSIVQNISSGVEHSGHIFVQLFNRTLEIFFLRLPRVVSLVVAMEFLASTTGKLSLTWWAFPICTYTVEGCFVYASLQEKEKFHGLLFMTTVPNSLGAKTNFLVHFLWLLFQTVLARTSVQGIPPYLALVRYPPVTGSQGVLPYLVLVRLLLRQVRKVYHLSWPLYGLFT